MYDKILVPFDGTEEAREGARHAINLAASTGATVHGVYVIHLPGAPRTVYLREDEDDLREQYEEYAEEVTTEIAELAAESGVDYTTAIRRGSVHEEIIEYGEEQDVDVIVMGAAYRGRVGALLGGMAEKVVRTSPIPVTTVRWNRNE
jgi:nucleotide-binding universal stress UspA family protein